MLIRQIKAAMIAAAVLVVTAERAFALPVLQLFIEDAVYERAGDNPDDPDTWAKVGVGSFRLWVLADTTKGPINDVRFVASFDDGLTPSLSFGPSRENNTQGFNDLTIPGAVTGPSAPFDAELLNPPTGPLADHGVLHTGRTAVEYGLGNFTESATFLGDVEPGGSDQTFASGFPDAQTSHLGQINVYNVLVSGLAVGEQVHFDVYGTQARKNGDVTVNAPFSHDARWQQAELVPEPGSILLLMGGLLGLAAVRRRVPRSLAPSPAA